MTMGVWLVSHICETMLRKATEPFWKRPGGPVQLVFPRAKGRGEACLFQIEDPEWIAFRSHWGFETEFCNPARGNEKGRVESEVLRVA
jgi:hypothetical protein